MSELRAIDVPKWGLSMEEGTITSWLVAEGDDFTEGQSLAEIETSKISNEVEAPFSGHVRRIVGQEGETLPVGALIAVAGDASVSDADVDAFVAAHVPEGAAPAAPAAAPAPVAAAPAAAPVPAAAAPAPAAPAPAPVAPAAPAAPGDVRIPAELRGLTDPGVSFATPHALARAKEYGIDLAMVPGSGPLGRVSVEDLTRAVTEAGGSLPAPPPAERTGRPLRSREDDSVVPATPVARRLARELGINLHDCRATGSRGRVSRADVEEARRRFALEADAPAAPAEAAPAEPEFETIPFTAMRRTIAQRLQEAKRNAPHFRLTVDLDLGRLLALRREINASVPEVKLSVNDMLIKAAGHALVRVPDVNVQFDEATQSVKRFRDADVAMAVALPSGLITPILRAVNTKSFTEIAHDRLDLVTKAKAGRLALDEFQGGTFCVSNLGMFGIKQFDAIINPPQGAILAVGAAERRPVYEGDQLVPKTLLTVTLTSDHRVIDGALGATFLQEYKRLVEAPALMLA